MGSWRAGRGRRVAILYGLFGFLVVATVGVAMYAVLSASGSPGEGELATPQAAQDSASPRAHPESQAPDFSLSDLDGQTVALSQLQGRPVLLFFWATW